MSEQRLTWCPKCRQSFFEPGSVPRSYVCVDRSMHPAKFLPAMKRPVGTAIRLVLAGRAR